jgi:ppGpp synthetase/RelA/SpoT-type nucleotidyltranferase
LKKLLEEILTADGIDATFESRTKTVQSFEEKIARIGKSYLNPNEDVTDFAGIRIILQSLNDLPKVVTVIRKELEVDASRSVSKKENLDPDCFGYLSEHFIVRIKEPRTQLPEWQALVGRWAEIQVRTILQHAWASIQHSLDYKSEKDVPAALRRRLFRLSALFELADQELEAIVEAITSTNLKYREELATGNTDLEIDLEAYKLYLETSPNVKYWQDVVRSIPKMEVRSSEHLSDDIRIANDCGYHKISEIDQLLVDARGWGEDFLSSFFKIYEAQQDREYRKVETFRNVPVFLLMLAKNFQKLPPNYFEQQLGWAEAPPIVAALEQIDKSKFPRP